MKCTVKRVFTIAVATSGAALVLASCGGADKAPGKPDSAATLAATNSRDSTAQLAAQRAVAPAAVDPACNFQEGYSTTCAGFTTLDFSVAANSAAAVKFLNEMEKAKGFDKESKFEKRAPENALGPNPIHKVVGNKDAHRLNFLNFNNGQLVIARFDVKENSEKDKRYKLELDLSMRAKSYYVVLTPTRIETTPVNNGYTIARWSIYAIVKGAGGSEELKQVGSSGSFRSCQFSHAAADYGTGARYLDCAADAQLHMIASKPAVDSALRQQKKSLLDAIKAQLPGVSSTQMTEKNIRQALNKVFSRPGASAQSLQEFVTDAEVATIVKAFTDSPTAPAWIICGVGCCTVDE